MNEPVYESAPLPPAEPKKSNNTMIIAIVAVVLLCCCCLCIGVLGWQFGDEIVRQLG